MMCLYLIYISIPVCDRSMEKLGCVVVITRIITTIGLGSLLDPSNVCSLLDPSNVCSLLDPSNVCSLLDPSNVCSLLDPSNVCSLLDLSNMCSLLDSSNVCSLLDPSNVCLLLDPSNVCSLCDPSNVCSLLDPSNVCCLCRYGYRYGPKDPTFNAGVYGINLQLWKEKRVTEEVEYWMRENKRSPLWQYGTQPLMLITLYQEWDYLDPRWNFNGLWANVLLSYTLM